jgi:3-hydroxyacyl-CoA dehydrogenase/enoyl-CoA hydratase/3-hydroxybutyryl-CoA epimerase
MDRFQPDLAGAGASRADVIIEAIFENAEAKMNLFAGLEKVAKPDAILATNTSSIPLETLCNALSMPGRLVGLHFFNPVAKMQLVEIVNGEKTFPKVSKRATSFAAAISRLPLPVKSSPGFLVNRILMPYLMEAVEMHKEGVPSPVIDKVATRFGMPMGPITLADTVGLDICQHVATNLSESYGGEVPSVLSQKVEAGKLGKKSGEGFYKWSKGKADKSDGPKDYSAPADLEDRLVFRYLNEAVACLNESIVTSGQLADGGLIFGTGFAPFRGGPINYIIDNDQQAMLSKLESLHQKYGDRFKPNEGWRSLNLKDQYAVVDA